MADARSTAPPKKSSFPFQQHLTASRRPLSASARDLSTADDNADGAAQTGRDDGSDADGDEPLSFFQPYRKNAISLLQPHGSVVPRPAQETKRHLAKGGKCRDTADHVSDTRKRRKLSPEYWSVNSGHDGPHIDKGKAKARSAPNENRDDTHAPVQARGKGKPASPSKASKGKGKATLVAAEIDSEEDPIDMAETGRGPARAARLSRPSRPRKATGDAPLDSSPVSSRRQPNKPPTRAQPITIDSDSDSIGTRSSHDALVKSSPPIQRADIDEPAEEDGESVVEGREHDLDDELAEFDARVKARVTTASKAPITLILSSMIPESQVLKVFRLMNQPMAAVLDSWLQAQASRGLDLSQDQVFMTWKGRKIYQYSTASSLGVEVDPEGRMIAHTRDGYINGGLHFEVWTDDLYARFLADKEHERALELGLGITEEQPEVEALETEAEEAEPRASYRIALKAKDKEALKMTVFSDTTVGMLIDAFCEQRGVDNGNHVAIHYEGDLLDEDSLVTDIDDLDEDDVTMLDVHIR